MRTNAASITLEVTQTISLKLPDDLVAELEREAKARRVTKSAVIRESLEAAVRPRARTRARRPLSCFDLASDLAGSLRGLQRDLAQNPKYMDGFGE